MFVVNLAFSDLCMMITQGPNVIINCFTNRVWMWGHLGCKLYAFTGALFGVISIITMVIIGYDRYNVIVKVNASYKWKENLIKVYPLVGTVGEEDHAGHGVPGHPPHLDLRHRHHHLPLLGLGRLHGGGAPHHLHLQLPGPCEQLVCA